MAALCVWLAATFREVELADVEPLIHAAVAAYNPDILQPMT